MPTVIITVDSIGGPNVGIKPYVEAALALVQYPDTCYNPDQRFKFKFTSNFGMMVTIGGKIDIQIAGKEIYSHDFPAVGIFSIKKYQHGK